MSRREKTIRNAFRCIRVVAVASVFALIAGSAIAQTGLGVTKTCFPNPPATVAQLTTYTCNYLVANQTNVQVDNLVVSDLYPFPVGVTTSPIPCAGGLSATSLAAAGLAGDSCGGTLTLLAPDVDCGSGSVFIRNRVSATAIHSVNGSQVGGGATNGVFVARESCPLSCGFLVIDEDSIDNGNPPNFFSDVDVNDQIAEIGVRAQLPVFEAAAAEIPPVTINLWTGTVGDEGWFALKTIPSNWENGLITDGLLNFWLAGKGLGSGKNREKFLDKIPLVTPLRADGLKSLEGECVCAVVYDSDISINYDPLNGSLKGANLGTVAFMVNTVTQLTGQSSGSLPVVNVTPLNAEEVCDFPLGLFTDVPEPISSSEPYDVVPN